MTNWFLTLCGSAAAPYRMFGFPFSGGSAVAYADWKAWLRDDIHFLGVQLPGRGMRMTEPLIHNMGELVPQLIESNNHCMLTQVILDCGAFPGAS